MLGFTFVLCSCVAFHKCTETSVCGELHYPLGLTCFSPLFLWSAWGGWSGFLWCSGSPMVWMCHSLFIEENLDSFQFWAVLNEATVDVHVQAFVWTLGFQLVWEGVAGWCAKTWCSFLRNCQTLPKLAAPFCIPLSEARGFLLRLGFGCICRQCSGVILVGV